MVNPHIITFEGDIENEIRAKSASLTDIAASSGVVENRPEKIALSWVMLVVAAIVILASGIGAYFYYVKQANTSSKNVEVDNKSTKSVEVFGGSAQENSPAVATSTRAAGEKSGTLSKKKLVQLPLDTVFPHVFPFIGKNFIKLESLGTGYIITFSSYNEVYKGVLDNEESFFLDLLLLYGDASHVVGERSDVRVGDLDARTGSGETNKKIYYAFIKPSTIIIADNKETLLILSDAILK